LAAAERHYPPNSDARLNASRSFGGVPASAAETPARSPMSLRPSSSAGRECRAHAAVKTTSDARHTLGICPLDL